MNKFIASLVFFGAAAFATLHMFSNTVGEERYSFEHTVFADQHNMGLAYDDIRRHFSTKDMYLHVIEDGGKTHQIDATYAIEGIHWLKAYDGHSIVKLTEIIPEYHGDSMGYKIGHDLAVISNDDIKSIRHNIAVSEKEHNIKDFDHNIIPSGLPDDGVTPHDTEILNEILK